MNSWTLIRRSLRYYWRSHLGVVLGAACAAAVLVGALAVGDSVRLSLRDQAIDRIGRVEIALAAGERLFGADLADRIAPELAGSTVAPLLQLRGVASASGGTVRTGIVDVFGVDQRFFALSPRAVRRAVPHPGQAYVNSRLAMQLGVSAGDEVLLRIERPSAMPRDLVMATVDDTSVAVRVQVCGVIGESDFGRFSLRASQVPPFDVFISLSWLQQQLDVAGRANLVLAGGGDGGAEFVDRANRAARTNWQLSDAELSARPVAGTPFHELVSGRVFIDAPIARALAELEPDLLGVLTYFVNELRLGDRVTPYSMVTAMGPLSPSGTPSPPNLAAGAGADGIVFTDWLADDLQAKIGDSIRLEYFVAGPQLKLQLASHSFSVTAVQPLVGAAADPTLMPEFPGLAGAASCRDWDPGIPVDLGQLDDRDQRYWEEHRGTPKAYVELRAGQALWGNRFGTLTAVRGTSEQIARVATELPRSFDPAQLGLFFRDLRGPALAAGTPATDFGGLFLGLSFFLIAAAVLLTALLFVFGVEQRAAEIGTLSALGFSPRRVRWLVLTEALLLAAIGSAAGAGLGMAYTRGVLWALGTLWRDAVGATTLSFHAQPMTVVAGVVASVAVAVAAIALVLRKTLRRPAVELLSFRHGLGAVAPGHPGRSLAVAVICVLAALALAFSAGTSSQQAAGAFFGAGTLLLLGMLSGCRGLLLGCARAAGAVQAVATLGIRNSGRRLGRSLATIALLACGTFLVVAVQAYRLPPPRDASVRASGTGGFELYARSTLPVLRDLATAEGRDAYGLDSADMEEVGIVPLRVRDGDDASCLNLSLPQNPRLLGVSPAALAARGAFQFAASESPPGPASASAWELLDADYGAGVVPAIGDAASVTWTLHKGIGDTVEYTDDRGQTFAVRIVATLTDSILQGSLVISESQFQQRFPSVSGYSTLLIDAPAGRREAVASDLTRALTDLGVEVTSTATRLQGFHAVQNTYLLIFQALGGLGLLLGSVGLGMVVLRNALERRSELALLSAVGFPARAVRQLVWSEHGLLLLLGLTAGVVAALVAVIPGMRAPASSVPMGSIALLVGLVGASGGVWVWLATAWATRGPLLDALREE